MRREDHQSVLSEDTKTLHTQLLGLEPAPSPVSVSGRKWEELPVGVIWHRCLGFSTILLCSSWAARSLQRLDHWQVFLFYNKQSGLFMALQLDPFFPQIISQRFWLRRVKYPPPQGT